MSSHFPHDTTQNISIPTYQRTWIGADFWANRLQDWQLNVGRLECITEATDKPLRTVHLLSHQVNEQNTSFILEVRTGFLGFNWKEDGNSFTGFLIGGGEGKLDYRSAALIHHFSGGGGGLLAVIDETGQLAFRKNNDNKNFDQFPLFEEQERGKELYPRSSSGANWEDILLRLEAKPESNGKYSLLLKAINFHTKELMSTITANNISSEQLMGNIALVSHPGNKDKGKRYWFRDFSLEGDKISHFPERKFGPILNTFYSTSGSILKLSAQFPPLGFGDNNSCTLEMRKAEKWVEVASAKISAPAFLALFRIENYDVTLNTDYRVRYKMQGKDHFYNGKIKAEPASTDEVKIAGFTCYQVIGLPADNSWGAGYAGVAENRWEQKNIWFPHNALIDHVSEKSPDLLVFLGDQIYEGGNPTNSDHSEANPGLDYFYKYFIFLWDFRNLTRNIPSIVLTDDHDVYQGDLWGAGGEPSTDGKNKSGGYVHEPAFVNMVEKTQTAHNPDLYDPSPIKQGIGVYYGGFKYGGIGIAFLEDRKFKSLPSVIGEREQYGSKVIGDMSNEALDIQEAKLLGDRQLHFLEGWINDWEDISMRLVVTQTIYASLHTTPEGDIWRDLDSGGWPQTGRNRALQLMRKGHTVIMGGDTHLPTLLQHGTDQFNDAPFQLVVPAVSNKYRRWWSPNTEGKNNPRKDFKNTGEYLDGLGNRVTVYAVGNPLISNKEVFDQNKALGKGYGSEHIYLNEDKVQNGYGIIKFNKQEMNITFECWDSKKNQQMKGWPFTIDVSANYMKSLNYYLPEIKISSNEPVLFTVKEAKTNTLIYALRDSKSVVQLKVPNTERYILEINTDSGNTKVFENLKGTNSPTKKPLVITFKK
ncbi:MAG: alkaline phosphatase D family protein [Bacteroidota bacterium]